MNLQDQCCAVAVPTQIEELTNFLQYEVSHLREVKFSLKSKIDKLKGYDLREEVDSKPCPTETPNGALQGIQFLLAEFRDITNDIEFLDRRLSEVI